MVSATLSYAKLNSEEYANKMFLMLDFVRKQEVKFMRRDDPRCWKVGKDGVSGIKWNLKL